MARPKGSKNKITIERELAAAADEKARRAVPFGRPKPLAKERLEELCDTYAGWVAKYQPGAAEYDEGKYRHWVGKYEGALIALAPYQSPRLSAVAVGQVTKMTVQVIGGIPARPRTPPSVAPPAQIEPPKVTDAA